MFQDFIRISGKQLNHDEIHDLMEKIVKVNVEDDGIVTLSMTYHEENDTNVVVFGVQISK